MSRSNAFRLIAFVVVLAIYVSVRFWELSATCLWFDEMFSVHAAERPWNSILDFVALDLIHPPLFYLILKAWIGIGGQSLFWLRSLPVLFSIIGVVPFCLLCRGMRLSFWTTLFAFLLIAVNGSLIKYAQEVRMYSMLMCMSLFSIWLFVRFVNVGRGVVLLTFVNVLLVYTHYFGWFVIASEIVATLSLQRTKWRSIIISGGVTLLGFAPWLYKVLRAANSGSELSQNIGWMRRPGLSAIIQLMLGLAEPFYYQSTSGEPLSNYVISAPMLILAFIAIVWYFVSRQRSDTERSSALYLMLIFVAVPLILAFIASWILPYSIWGMRHLIIIFVPASVLVANSSADLKPVAYRTIVIASMGLFVLIGSALYLRRPNVQPIWCGFETIGDTLQTRSKGSIYVFEDLAAYHLWFSFRNLPPGEFHPKVIKVDGFPGMAEDNAYFIPRGFHDDLLVRGKFPTTGPYWIVYRSKSLDLTKPPLDTLTMNGMKVTEREVYDGGESKIYAVYLEPSTGGSY